MPDPLGKMQNWVVLTRYSMKLRYYMMDAGSIPAASTKAHSDEWSYGGVMVSTWCGDDRGEAARQGCCERQQEPLDANDVSTP